MGPRADMEALEAGLHEAFPGQLSLHTIKSPRYRDWMCEIAPAGVTKWSGVMGMAAAWGIAAEEICAVGDDVNDLPMIRAAGLGLAMGNARPEVQAAAAQHDLARGSFDGTLVGQLEDPAADELQREQVAERLVARLLQGFEGVEQGVGRGRLAAGIVGCWKAAPPPGDRLGRRGRPGLGRDVVRVE
ncbi:MAG: HAD family hydrolase, partial [Planctomycetota bacterium]